MGLLNWGILTAGNISHQFATALTSLPADEHKLVAVAAREPIKAMQFALKYGITAYKTYLDLVTDSVIDVVYIGTINTKHLPLAKLALQHGKHVLCEKPLCINVKETKELIEEARRNGRFLMEALWSRFFPSYQRLREELQNGSIGHIEKMISTFGVDYAKKNRKISRASGGGGILDIGVYNVQMALFVFGGLVPCHIESRGTLTSDGVDQSNTTVLTFQNGQIATLITDTKEDLNNEVVLMGTKGTIIVRRPFWRATALNLGDGSVVEFPQPMDKEGKVNKSIGLSYQCHEVKRCIDAGLIESPMMSHMESIRISEIMEEMLKQMGINYEQLVKFPATCRELFFTRPLSLDYYWFRREDEVIEQPIDLNDEEILSKPDRDILQLSQTGWRTLVGEFGLEKDSVKQLMELMNIHWIKTKVIGKFPTNVRIPFLALVVYEGPEIHSARLGHPSRRKNQSVTMMDISGKILAAVDSDLLPQMIPGVALALHNIQLLATPNKRYVALALTAKNVIGITGVQGASCQTFKAFSPDQIKKDYQDMMDRNIEPSDNNESVSAITDDEEWANAIQLIENVVFSD